MPGLQNQEGIILVARINTFSELREIRFVEDIVELIPSTALTNRWGDIGNNCEIPKLEKIISGKIKE